MFHLISKEGERVVYFPSLNKIFNITTEKYEKDFLVIGVTNNCTFQCIYCYGIDGSYGKKIQMISENKLFNVLDFFINRFTNINQIQFFGGEPLIEFNLIRKICNYFIKMKKARKIIKIPNITIVTNGSIISKEILKFFKDYNFSVTVSLDGPPEINNLLRKYRDGSDTFKNISNTINLLRENNIQYGIEATYTQYHIKLGISICDLIQFFYETFGLTSVHIPPVSSNNSHIALFPEYTKETIKIYNNAINNCLKNWIEGELLSFSFLDRYIYALIKLKTSNIFCPAGYDTIALSWEGKIYPCFMFYGKDFFEDTKIMLEKEKKDFQMPTKLKYKSCRNCWMKYLCSICIGGVYIETGSFHEIPEYFCEWQKGMIEEIIFNISKIRNNIDVWKKFVKNLRKHKEKDV